MTEPIRTIKELLEAYADGTLKDRQVILPPYADLSGADLYDANLSVADLSRANLYDANLRSANLYDANLSRANLYDANLSRANLYDANLRSANLYDANLSDANLRSANLRVADLCGANLAGADLRDVDLSRTDLAGANLAGANLTNTCLDPNAPIPTTDLSAFERDDNGLLIAYRTQRSVYVGHTIYELGKYTAPVFSVSTESGCHPGIYGVPALAELNKLKFSGYGKIKMLVDPAVALKAGDKYRFKTINVVQIIEQENKP